jgi:membrane protease subunit HflK
MARQGWGEGPIDIGGTSVQIPNLPRPSRGVIALVGLVAVAVLLIITGYYQVEPDEVGVVQRFGRHVRTTSSGPHLKIPFGVERVTKVPVQRQLKMEFGFRTMQAGIRSSFGVPSQELAAESAMLTGDLNVAVVEWIVQYRIRDPAAYLFKVRNVDGSRLSPRIPSDTLRYMAEAAMRQVVGDHSVDEVLTIGRESIALQAKDELQRLCDLYEVGIEIQQLVLQDVNPPDPVKPAFNEVNQAIQEKERAINEAWADYNKAVPRAKGEAEQMIRAAEGYNLERVNNAQGDAKRFTSLYEEYRKAPQVTRTRMYLETMGELVPKMGRKLILDEKARGILPLLQLGGEQKEVKP